MQYLIESSLERLMELARHNQIVDDYLVTEDEVRIRQGSLELVFAPAEAVDLLRVLLPAYARAAKYAAPGNPAQSEEDE